MGLKLRVNTKNNKDEKSCLLGLEEELEEQPLSPTSEFLMSLASTFYVLCFFEVEIPVDYTIGVLFFDDVFVRCHPRLSSIVVENKGRKMWKKVIVNLEDHKKVASFTEGLSLEKFDEEYDKYISKIATSPLPTDKPLWDVHIINCPKGYHVPAIVIFKFHHLVGDGTSLMAAVLSCSKRVDDPSLPLVFPSKNNATSSEIIDTKKLNIFNMVPIFISSVIKSVYEFGQGIRLLFFKDSLTPIKSGYADAALPFSARVSSYILSLHDVKRIKALLGVTVNDVVVGIIFLGTRLYMEERDGKLNNTRTTASMAVNTRSVKGNVTLEEMRKDKTWGNRISVIDLPLPKLEDRDLTNPLNFIYKIHKNIKEKKNNSNHGPLSKAKILDVIKRFVGLKIAAKLIERKWRNGSFVITNVIGPAQKISFANHPIKSIYFTPTGASMSLKFSVMSYVDELRLGIVVEKGFIDPKRLITCLDKAFQLTLNDARANPNFAAY